MMPGVKTLPVSIPPGMLTLGEEAAMWCFLPWPEQEEWPQEPRLTAMSLMLISRFKEPSGMHCVHIHGVDVTPSR